MINDRVAPIRGMSVKDRPWEGSLPRKPWEYPVTCAIAHRDTPEMLAGVVSLFRAQTIRPYFVIVDTGSDFDSMSTLHTLDANDDCEVHYLRSKAWRGSSCPVAAAMDLAFAICQTESLISTHTDVFLTRPDLVEHLLSLCDARTPVVGWQMSPRVEWPDDSWKNTPSHTASIYHMPSMRSLGASWNMLRAFDALHRPHGQTTGGYPDTETTLGLILEDHDITPRWEHEPDDGGRHWLCLGPEPNEPYATPWFHHVRSTGSVKIYWPNTLIAVLRDHQVNQELAAIPDRIEAWKQNQTGRSSIKTQEFSTG